MRGFVVLFGRFLTSFVFMGTTKAYGVLIPYLVEQLEASEGSIGLCGSLLAGLPHVAGLITTPLVNRYGVRNAVILGGTITVLGLLCASMCTNVLQLGLCLAIAGYCNGFCIISMVVPLTWHFPDNFALVNGISSSGSAFGMIILPPVTEVLLELYGWRGTVMILAAINSYCILAGVIIKEPKHDKFETKENPSRCEKQSRILEILQKIDEHMIKLFPILACYYLIFLMFGTSISAWMLFLVTSSIEKGVTPKNAALLSTIGGVGQIFGKILHGPLINFGITTDLQLFGILSFVCAICFTIDPWLSGYLTYSISAFVVAFATGAQYTLCLTITNTLVTKRELLISAMGWTQLFMGMGKILGGSLVGYLHDATGGYTVPYITLGGIQMLSVFIIMQIQYQRKSPSKYSPL